MADPKCYRHPLRIALAFIFCIGVISGGLAFITSRKPTYLGDRLQKAAKQISKENDEGGFFYKSIGQRRVESGIDEGNPAVRVAKAAGYTVEFSAPTHQKDAEQLLDKLRAQGIQAYYTPLSDNGRIVYRVRRGIYPNEGLAQKEARDIAKVVGPEPQVVKLE